MFRSPPLMLVALLLLHTVFHNPLSASPQIQVGTYGQEMRTAYTADDGLASDDVRAIAQLPDGTIVAGTSDGLSQFMGGVWSAMAGSPSDVRVLEVSKGVVYVATTTGLFGLDKGVFTSIATDVGGLISAIEADETSQETRLLVATDKGLFSVTAEGVTAIPVTDFASKTISDIHDVVIDNRGRIVVATSSWTLAQSPDSGWELLHASDGNRGWTMVNAPAVFAGTNSPLVITAPQGVAIQQTVDAWALYSGQDGLPYNDFTAVAEGGGRLWFGTKDGAIHFDGEHWAYRAGKRWIPDNDVRDIVATADGAWIATAGGVSHIYFQPMTFAEKAAHFEAEIDLFGRRTPFEYINGVTLDTPGDRSTWTQHDTDNDGQYTGLYGAAECLAYAATGDKKAKERANKAFEALAFLSEVTQSGSNPAPAGFIARSILPTEGRNPNVHDSVEHDTKKREGDALWKILDPRWPTSGDGKWYWKTDASSDELDGHFLLYGLYYDHVAKTEAEKARVREVTARVIDHLIENGFHLVDHDGTSTRWGHFSPESLNGDPNWWTERGLNSLSMLTYLSVAHHVTGEQRYRDVFMDLVENHQYALNGMIAPKLQFGPGSHVQFDDKMAFMNYYHLIAYETDPEVLRMFQNSIFYYWQIVRQERNPFFNFVYAALCEGKGMQTQWGVTDLSPTDDWLEDSVDTLKRFPMDLILWATKNSHRLDLVPLGAHTREPGKAAGHGHRVDGYVIPIDERNAISLSEDTWRYDDTNAKGLWLDEGSPFLLSYYLGLYHGFIEE